VIYSSYRLASEANRQSSDQLIFLQQFETLELVDFAGRIIYEQEWSSCNFIDIYLNIAEFILVNNANFAIWFAFSAWGFSVTAYLVPAGTWRIVDLLMDDYTVRILNANNQILDVRQVSVSQNNGTQTGSTDIIYPLALPPSSWEVLLELIGWALQILFFTYPWSLIFWIPFSIYLLFKSIQWYRHHKNQRIADFVAGMEYAQQKGKKSISKQDILEALAKRKQVM